MEIFQNVNSFQMMTDTNCPLKLLYVTPEKVAKSKMFMNKLQKAYELGTFTQIAIDEVHCCSQWGHDFRPDYKVKMIYFSLSYDTFFMMFQWLMCLRMA